MTTRTLAICLCCILPSLATPSHVAGQDYVAGETIEATYEDLAAPFLEMHCVDCHSGSQPEADFSLEDIGPVDETNAATWKSIWAQVSLKEMPPADAAQPEMVDRLRMSEWITQNLDAAMQAQGGFRAHLDPEKANFLDHDLLFGALPDGVELKPTSSPARLWRISPDEQLTRYNELINKEAPFNPKRPGLRTHGDAVPRNHGGELKLYFGVDRIARWQGGTVAYATSVKSVPVVFANAKDHGLSNYPDFYSVNSAEATQILSFADDLIRYMARGPRSLVGPEQITDDPDNHTFSGDLRGLPSGIVYNTKIMRPITPVYHLVVSDAPDESLMRAAIDFLFESLTFRAPTAQESDEYLSILKRTIDRLGVENGSVLGLSAIFLDRESMFRSELANDQEPDQHGRAMLQDWELGLAVNHALCYIKPDKQLREAIVDGRMRTREDVKRQVERMLADERIRKPRILQFFRDYFDYDHANSICKDVNALHAAGIQGKNQNAYDRAMVNGVASTDRLVELILAEDRAVLKTLLTTNQLVASPQASNFMGRLRSSEELAILEPKQPSNQVEIDKLNAAFAILTQKIADVEAKLEKDVSEKKQKKLSNELSHLTQRIEKIKKNILLEERRAFKLLVPAKLKGKRIYARVSRRSFGKGSMKEERFLTTVPEGERLGILTHPSWLISHSDAMDNHAIRRGRWVRERLLGGGIPDVPITVDAMLPEEPHNTLRKRMRVTREDYCWQCHQKMDPLGLAFEMYNHVGIYRAEELGEPVDAGGEIIDSGDPELDGEVDNAIEMIRKIAKSERVEQVFVRHAFRFWMGRNETIHDRPVLQEAHRAYRDSGGSMNALITSLLTSDAFLYRNVR